MGWRLILVLIFIPCGIPWGACTLGQMIVAAACWLAAGPDEKRTERLILGAPAAWFIVPLDRVAAKAGAGVTS